MRINEALINVNNVHYVSLCLYFPPSFSVIARYNRNEFLSTNAIYSAYCDKNECFEIMNSYYESSERYLRTIVHRRCVR